MPRETWLMCTRDREAEPVLVIDHGAVVELVLDDGSRLGFDRRELHKALDGAPLPIAGDPNTRRCTCGAAGSVHESSCALVARDAA